MLLVAVLLCAGFTYPFIGRAAGPTTGNFAAGDSAYEAGKFSEAADAYQREIHAGRYSANLFYNLGNAEYRLGDLGRAVLNYQRALLLEPGHIEAVANLAYVRGKTPVRPAAPPTLADGFRATLGVLDVNTYTILAAVAGWLAAAGFLLGLFSRRRRQTGWVLLGVALPVFAAFLAALWFLGDGRKDAERAVVLKDQTPARYAPADSAKTIVKLPVGEELHVLSERGEWTYAQLSDGTLGWLPANTVERIIPPAALAQGQP